MSASGMGAGACALAVMVMLSACASGTARAADPPATAGATTTLSGIPAADVATVAHEFNQILGAANGPLYAFAARIKSGVPADAASMPADLVALATAAANAYSVVASSLQSSRWPPALGPSITAVTAASQTFLADMQLLTTLSPQVFADWQRHFAADGQTLNDAENTVRAELGLGPVPAS